MRPRPILIYGKAGVWELCYVAGASVGSEGQNEKRRSTKSGQNQKQIPRRRVPHSLRRLQRVRALTLPFRRPHATKTPSSREPSKKLADTDPVHALHNTGGQAKTGLTASRISPPVVPCYEWKNIT